MQKKHLTFSNIIFAIFIILLIIPQTRTAMLVAVNKIRVLVLSPSELNVEEQTELGAFDYLLTDLEGQLVHIAIGKDKAVFLSYWATWCPPCIAEMPSIQELYNDYGDKIDFVLLTSEDPETVRSFLEKKQYNLPVFIPRMQAPEKLYGRSIPTNYIIDKSGKIIIKETGAANWNSQKLRVILESLE